MRKTVSMLLIIVTMISVLSGCSSNESTEYVISDYDSESIIQVSKSEELSASQGENTSESTEEDTAFLVKHKIYAYEENNIVIVDITNETETDYNFTITGNYLNDDGEVLKAETKSFMFPADYQKYFLFQPGIPFSEFTYTVEMTETTETCFAKYLSLKFKGVRETVMTSDEPGDDYTFYPSIIAETSSSYVGQENILVGFHLTWLIFDEDDQLLSIFGNLESYKSYYPNPSFDGASSYIVYQTKKDKIEPEISKKYSGKIRAIVVVGNQLMGDQLPHP